jgi:hypothetical protein
MLFRSLDLRVMTLPSVVNQTVNLPYARNSYLLLHLYMEESYTVFKLLVAT